MSLVNGRFNSIPQAKLKAGVSTTPSGLLSNPFSSETINTVTSARPLQPVNNNTLNGVLNGIGFNAQSSSLSANPLFNIGKPGATPTNLFSNTIEGSASSGLFAMPDERFMPSADDPLGLKRASQKLPPTPLSEMTLMTLPTPTSSKPSGDLNAFLKKLLIATLKTRKEENANSTNRAPLISAPTQRQTTEPASTPDAPAIEGGESTLTQAEIDRLGEAALTEQITSGQIKVVNDGSGGASAFGGALGIGGSASAPTTEGVVSDPIPSTSRNVMLPPNASEGLKNVNNTALG